MDRSEPRVVVGVSPSFAGLAALRFAVAEAKRRQAPLYAVRAWFLHPIYDDTEARLWRARMADEAAHVAHEAFAAAMGDVPADLRVTVVAAGERADQALLRIAGRRDDLLVLGGRTGVRWTSWIVRSCMRLAVCPVTVVPPPELAGTVQRRSALRTLLRDVERFAA